MQKNTITGLGRNSVVSFIVPLFYISLQYFIRSKKIRGRNLWRFS